MRRKTTTNSRDLYQRGNDYDQSELFTGQSSDIYVTIAMLNQAINYLLGIINTKQDNLKIQYIDYTDPNTQETDKYVHGLSGKDIFAEVSRKAIEDEYGDNIEQTYLKKTDITYQYNEDDEIVGINNSAIAAGEGSKKLIGQDGVYVNNDLTAYHIGISADYAYNSALSSYQPKLSDDEMTDIYSIPFKLDKTEFEETISSYATKQYVEDQIAEIGTPLVIRGSKTCQEIEEITEPKVGDVYCMENTGIIHQPDYEDLQVNEKDEVAFTSDKGWIVIGREVAVDLTDYYKKYETSGASQISAALDSIDLKFNNYYTKTETSSTGQIDTALASKLDSTAMTAYYTKSETSGAQEIDEALSSKVDKSTMQYYVETTALATNYYDKTETSSKNEIANALTGKVDNEELELYYTMSETSGSDQLSAAFNEKLDSTAFNLSSTAWNDTTDVVRANSAAWAEGGGSGDPEVNALVHSNSATWNGVSSKLDETAFSTISASFLTQTIADTLYQPIGDYATTKDLSSKVETSSMYEVLEDYVTTNTLTSNYYTTDEVDSEFDRVDDVLSGKADYEYLQDNYYNVTETSGADEISDALDLKLDTTSFSTVSASFITDNEISAGDWNDTTDVVRSNSAIWSQGNSAVNDLVTANSATWNTVSSKLDITAFSTVSGDFLTAHQDLSYISGQVDNKLDTTAYTPNAFYPMEGNPSGFLTGVDLSNYYTKNETYNKTELYTKTEVDSLMDGKIVVVTALPAIGDSSVIYYVGPNTSISGDDKYDEYIWDSTNERYIQVGEHSLDLSNYATTDNIADVYDFVDTSLQDKLDVSAVQGINNTITGINGSAIKDTTYIAGVNIDITNNTISGKDWSEEIESAVSSKADNKDVEDLSDEMAQGFADLGDTIESKLYTSSFAEVSSTFLTKTSADQDYYLKTETSAAQEIADALTAKQNSLTNEQLSAISSVSAIKGTILTGDSNIRATSAEEGNNIKWTLELTAQPVVTDTTLSGYSGIVATKDSVVSSQWNVGLEQGYVDSITSISGNSGHWNDAYEYATSASAIGVITKSDVDEIWAIVTGERA